MPADLMGRLMGGCWNSRQERERNREECKEREREREDKRNIFTYACMGIESSRRILRNYEQCSILDTG